MPPALGARVALRNRRSALRKSAPAGSNETSIGVPRDVEAEFSGVPENMGIEWVNMDRIATFLYEDVAQALVV